MQSFSKKKAVGEDSRLFEFTMLRNVNGEKCFITSKDANSKPISFSLKQKDKSWKLFPGALRWLYDIESELSDAIVSTRLQ